MKKVLKLTWGIVTKPVPTFKKIKEEKPFAGGLLIFFLTYSLLILNNFIFKHGATLKGINFLIKFRPFWQGLIVTTSLLILYFLALLLGIGIINLFARLFRGKGAFKSLLTCALFISAVHLIVFPLYVLLTALKLETATFTVSIVVSLWAIILFIIAIKTIYQFSLLRSISTYLCYFLTVIIILGVPLGLTYFKFVKSIDGVLEYFALEKKYRDLKESFWKEDVVYSKEEYKKALVDYSKFVEEYPGSDWAAFARSDIGEIYWEGLKEKEKAMEEYQGIIRDYPDSQYAASAQYDIANIYEDLEDYDQALTAYQKVITDYPKNDYAPMAQDSIGGIYEDLKDYDRALTAYRKVVTDYPKSDYTPDAQDNIADIYEDNFKDYQRAIEEYRKVIENYPKSNKADYAQYKIGRLYQWEFKDYNQAIKEYQKVIKNYPDSICAPWAQMKIGDIYYRKLNQKEQAIKAYQKVVEHYPAEFEALEAQIAIGDIYSNLGQKNKTIQMYRKAGKMYQDTFALQLEGTEMEAHVIVGDLYANKLGDYTRAMEVYQRLLKKDPQNIYASAARMGLGECYEYQGNYRQALREYKKVIDDYPKGTRTHAAKLKVEIFSNNPPPLLKIYTQEYKYWRNGQYEKALEKCREILKKYPKSHLASNAQYFIAFMYDCNLNNSEQALKEYQKLLAKYPESRWIKAAQQQINSLKAEVNKNK